MKSRARNDLSILFDGVKIIGITLMLVAIIFAWGLANFFHLKSLDLWLNKMTEASNPVK